MKNNDLFILFQAKLAQLTTEENVRFTIALSGGLDSVVLLHLFSRLETSGVTAHHIHHGLSENADHWVHFCQQQCDTLGITLLINHVVLDNKSRTSLEALAREARYLALQENFLQNSYLVTAHHQDDQLETILLALKRGAGLTGLQGIVAKQKLETGYLIRPLLDFSREQLALYASLHQLTWIEDESNDDQRFDRNFIRHSIAPLLKERWPAIAKTVSRSASHCQSQQAIIDELTEADFNQCAAKQSYLNITCLKGLSKSRRNNVIRFWFKKLDLNHPSTQQLNAIWNDIVLAQTDAVPQLKLQSRVLHRYRDKLYIINDLMDKTETKVVQWKGEDKLELCAGEMILQFEASDTFLFEKHNVEIYFRGQLPDGMKCQPIGRTKSRSVKKLLHEYHIPPWQRDFIPFIFVDGFLVEAVGVWRCDSTFSESLRIAII